MEFAKEGQAILETLQKWVYRQCVHYWSTMEAPGANLQNFDFLRGKFLVNGYIYLNLNLFSAALLLAAVTVTFKEK